MKTEKQITEVNDCWFQNPHFWIEVANKSGKGMKCFSCPSCGQKIYWSQITQDWINVTVLEKGNKVSE